MCFNEIEIILDLIKKNGKKIKLENTQKYQIITSKKTKESEIEIEWCFYIYKQENVYSLIYDKKTNNFMSITDIYNKVSSFSFLDDIWLKKNKLQENGKIFINEKCEYIYIGKNYIFALMFIIGICYEEVKKYDDIAKNELKKKYILENNFFIDFLKKCKNIGNNKYLFKTEVKEYNTNEVIFEYDETKNVEIDDFSIKWIVRVLVDYIDEKTKENKNIVSERFLDYNYVDNIYSCEVKLGKPMSDISYLYPKWCQKKNVEFKGNFYVSLNFQRIEDKIFCLETLNRGFAFMSFINANYDEIMEITI
jgi:hypothetical protein